MKAYSLYLFDLDGTVYRGRQPVPYAPATITELLRRGASVRYLTNNSAARPVQVSAMLNHMGVPCRSEWVIGSGQIAAAECRTKREVYVVGEDALRHTLTEAGVALGDRDPDTVLVGICRQITYEILDTAAAFVRQGKEFLATNRDATFPLEGGRLQPGAGAIVAAIEVASGRSPRVLGKPAPDIVLAALAGSDAALSETIIVGDRIDTDIACGQAAGCDTFLVLTGVERALPPGQAGAPDLRGLL
ncbi:MAG: HAD-IIA family hydrolase [Armatimonadetes bacterium]|nr:HAD-IIA family hydrolase [Armatimonadota bacterium]